MKGFKPAFTIVSFFIIYSLLLWASSSSTFEKPFMDVLAKPSMEIMRSFYINGIFASKYDLTKDRTEMSIGVKNKKLYYLIENQKKEGKKDLPELSFRGRMFYLDNFTIPLLLFITLSIITPIPIPLKAKRFVLGILLLWVYFIIRILVFLRLEMAIANLGDFYLSQTSGEILEALTKIMELGFSIIFAILLWLLLIFRNSIWYPNLLNILKSIESRASNSK
jgi:hypothetical protein